MTSPVENLVQRLHAKRNGKGWIAKCPGHDDRKPSLSISEGSDGRALIKCHAGCATEDVLSALGLTSKDLFPQELRLPSRNGSTPRPTFDWSRCCAAFTDKHASRLAEWPGYSLEFCQWLRENELIGICAGATAFPVHDNGKVVAAHCRSKSSDWRYHPKGTKTRPLVIGDLLPGDTFHIFESQWDGFGFMDVSGPS